MLGINRHNFPPNFVSLDEAVQKLTSIGNRISDIGIGIRYTCKNNEGK